MSYGGRSEALQLLVALESARASCEVMRSSTMILCRNQIRAELMILDLADWEPHELSSELKTCGRVLRDQKILIKSAQNRICVPKSPRSYRIMSRHIVSSLGIEFRSEWGKERINYSMLRFLVDTAGYLYNRFLDEGKLFHSFSSAGKTTAAEEWIRIRDLWMKFLGESGSNFERLLELADTDHLTKLEEFEFNQADA